MCIRDRVSGYDDGVIAPSERIAPLQPDHLAYVIYTSGSTGTPKGAANTHAGRVNDLLSMQDILQLTEEDRILHKTSLSFDVSVWEIFHALSIGCQVIIAKPGRVNDSQYYRDIVNKHAVTVTQFVPSMLCMIVDDLEPGDWASIRHLIVGGEALNSSVQTQLHNALPHAHLWNICLLYTSPSPRDS